MEPEAPGVGVDFDDGCFRSSTIQSLMGDAECWVIASMLEVLIESRATGVFDVVDPILTAVSMMSALVHAGML